MIKDKIEHWLSLWDLTWINNGDSYKLCCGEYVATLKVSDVESMVSCVNESRQTELFDKLIVTLNWKKCKKVPEWANPVCEQLSLGE